MDHANTAENRPRFAGFAVLYGLAVGHDRQLIYRDKPPHEVFSVDHGHFLPGSTGWTAASIQQHAGCELFPEFVKDCSLTDHELHKPLYALSQMKDSDIAECVAAPPAAWDITDAERIVLCNFFSTRRVQLTRTI
jgi:hypothetical protein